MSEDILKEYDENQSLLNDFKGKMVVLISELLKTEFISVHQISGRLKERKSLEKKIERKQDKYSGLKDITDITGIRVITYMESDVDKVADLMEKEFIIDTENSIDKRILKTDQFGYRSLHYVLSCNKERTKLIEYKRYKEIKFEIQIRSILQHAWAEIEHDLGYKGVVSIPDSYKRGFNRIAALLETADFEFDRLKRELSKYESEVAELIKTQPEKVTLDQASLLSFNQKNNILKKARTIIKKNVKCQFTYSTDFEGYIFGFKEIFKLNTINEIELILEKYEKEFLAFVKLFTSRLDYSELRETISIYYFQHFLSAVDEKQKFVDEYLMKRGISSDTGRFIELVKEAKTIANKT